MRIVATEEHFVTEDYQAYLRSRQEYPRRFVPPGRNSEITLCSPDNQAGYAGNPATAARLQDLGAGRLAAMDESGISVQVLSLAMPGVEQFAPRDGIEWAQRTNDELAAAVRQHPDRLAGLAALPLQDPDAAARELERAVRELGLCGAKIHSHVQGSYYDDRRFWPAFGKAEELGVPVYIHPAEPPADMLRPYLGYPGLAGGTLGFGANAAVCVMRMLLSGLFDEFPGLSIVLGHLGEALPFWKARIDALHRGGRAGASLKRSPGECLSTNFCFTTSGVFWEPTFLCVLLGYGADHMMFAVDYPHGSNEDAVAFMDGLALSAGDKERIYHANADRLFRLR